MAEISAAAVKSLRDRTNQPMMDCKKALTEANGDVEKAIDILRSRGKGITVKREGKETAEGRVVAYVDNDKHIGTLVEVRTESAPVAKTTQFIELCNDLARHIAENPVTSVADLVKQPYFVDSKRTVQDRIDETVSLIREKMIVARFARLTGGLLGSYCHHDGTVGVLLQVEGDKADPQLLRDICMHITATNPVSGSREEVPADVLQRERDVAIAQTREDPKMAGKPANIVEKAAEGKVSKWLEQNVLLDQPFVKDETKKIGELLKAAGLKYKKFVRFKVGVGDTSA
jgi:elongation factor Ts